MASRDTDQLLEALRSGDPDAVGQAADELAALGDRALASSLRTILADAIARKEPVRRDGAAVALASAEGADALQSLLEAMTHDLGDEQGDLAELVTELLEAHPEIATPIAREMLRSDGADTRAVGAWAVGYIGNPMTYPVLLSALGDRDPIVRAAAAEAMPTFKDQPEAFGRLVAALDDTDAQVRAAAASALGYVGSDNAVEPLSRALQDNAAMVRRQAAFALGLIGDKSSKPSLVTACDDPDPSVRESAEEALQRMEHSAV